MRRVAAYFVVWGTVIVVAVVWRLTYLRGTSSDRRLPLAVIVMIATAVLFVAANLYESRRLATLCGFRGRGVIEYARGWLKTMAIEIAANDDGVPREAYREWRMFRRLSGYALASLVIVLPVLLL